MKLLSNLAILAVPLAALAQPAPQPAPRADPKPAPQPAPASAPQPATPPNPSPSPKGPVSVIPEFHDGTGQRHESFNAISKEGKAQLVFLGDSITQGWEGEGKQVWADHYAKRNAANFGISGDRTEHVLWRLDHGNFDNLQPKLIVLMIGTNNAGHRKEAPAETAAGVHAILERLAKKCPDAKVLLLAIFPRGETPENEHRKLNIETNKLIARFADGKRVYFKDISAAFLDDKGNVKKDLMPDLVHPNQNGYRVWADAIESDVAKLLGEAK